MIWSDELHGHFMRVYTDLSGDPQYATEGRKNLKAKGWTEFASQMATFMPGIAKKQCVDRWNNLKAAFSALRWLQRTVQSSSGLGAMNPDESYRDYFLRHARQGGLCALSFVLCPAFVAASSSSSSFVITSLAPISSVLTACMQLK